MRCEGERPENDEDTRGRRHTQPKGGGEEAVWLQLNNALVCHTWTEFVGHICMGEGGGRDGDVDATQMDLSCLCVHENEVKAQQCIPVSSMRSQCHSPPWLKQALKTKPTNPFKQEKGANTD